MPNSLSHSSVRIMATITGSRYRTIFHQKILGACAWRISTAWAERRRDGDVRGIAAAGDQCPPDTWRVVPRVEHVPLPAEMGFEPGREVARRIGQGGADIAQVAGAVAGRDVQGAAEGDSQVRVVPTHPALVL